MGTVRITDANRLSTVKPDLAATLNVERSGVTPDSLTVASNRKVYWNCPDFPEHDPWEAVVNNRSGGFRKRYGTGCPTCRLRQTSAQELRLKAELSTVLAIDADRDAVHSGRVERVDMVIDADGLRMVLEFDGSYFHGNEQSARRDSEKSRRLRESGWIVVRIREAPLDLLDPAYDVRVGFLAEPETAAADVLDHLVVLGLLNSAAAEQYRALDAPQAQETASRWMRERIGEQAARRLEYSAQNDAWGFMFEELVAYEADTGDCYPTDQLCVDGRNLGRWCRKQRRLQRTGRLRADRAGRLATIATWSSRTAHEAGFWAGHDRYLRRAEPGDPREREELPSSRDATVWANNLRKRRAELIACGGDLPGDQFEAMEKVPGWSWDPYQDAHDTKVEVMQQFCAATGRPVSSVKQREQWNSHPVGVWLNSWRTRRDVLSASQEAELEALPGWTWDQQGDHWTAMLQHLQDFGAARGHIQPSLTLGDEHEKALARWKRNHKNRLRGRGDDKALRLRALLAQYGETLP
ncbi:Helicase associated domain protein [Streptomyces sp. RTGN2]|uniref:Helicase associated domain protein n=1 Tax=Streptomyces sp. RTGN2 TaxID=3016525 RepID=UPI0025574BC1|nr:Helicase associated domain protein [Streptomyces sp. RTGN2]